MNKPIFIVGAGGHAKVLLECLRHNETFEVKGFLEIDPKLIGTMVGDIPVYGQNIQLKQHDPKNIVLVNGIGSVDLPTLRAQQFQDLKKAGFNFFSIKHITAYCSSDVRIGEGTQLLAGSVVLTGTTIGCNTIINTSTSIDHDCDIGNHVHIAPGALLSGSVVIEDGCHIGVGATIIQGVRVGKNSLIAAGAVVIHDLPANSRVVGVPARSMA